jgi:hydroxymethylpyrimidine pyrophosphatase-like HAD family hydrolase
MTDSSLKTAKLVRPLFLAIDLDDTFVDANAGAREELFGLLETNADDVRLMYMSHDSAENLIKLAAKAELPVPELFMADSGTTLLTGDGSATIEPLQRDIIQLWPGKESVREALSSVEGVELLDDNAPCRQGFKASSEEALAQVREKATGLGCHVQPRGEGEYNLLPFGIEKGTTLGRYLVQKNINPDSVVIVAEDTGDECLFGRGWRGAAFAHAPESLREHAKRFHNAFALESDGPAAVVQALRSHGWIERPES